MEFIKHKKYIVAKKGGKQFYNNGDVYTVSVIKIRPYVIGSSYGGCYHQRKYFFYQDDTLLPITDVVDGGHNKCSFKLNGVNATAETKANPYGYSYKMSNAFDQGNSWNMFSNLSSQEGTEQVDIVITLDTPIRITRFGWENYTDGSRSIKDVEIYFNHLVAYRTPEADRNKYISKHDIQVFKK